MDVWAYGIFAYELATGNPPFSAVFGLHSLFQAVLKKPVPAIPNKWSSNFTDFIARCLDKSAVDRWTIEKLLNHPFLENAADCQ